MSGECWGMHWGKFIFFIGSILREVHWAQSERTGSLRWAFVSVCTRGIHTHQPEPVHCCSAQKSMRCDLVCWRSHKDCATLLCCIWRLNCVHWKQFSGFVFYRSSHQAIRMKLWFDPFSLVCWTNRKQLYDCFFLSNIDSGIVEFEQYFILSRPILFRENRFGNKRNNVNVLHQQTWPPQSPLMPGNLEHLMDCTHWVHLMNW